MAVGTVLLYDFLAKYLFNGSVDLDSNTVKCALVKSSYTLDQVAHDTWADVSAEEIAAAGGYSAGGVALASVALAAITRGYKFSSANVSIVATGGDIPAWRYAVFYVSGTVNGVLNPLIGLFVGNDTPADIAATPDGQTLLLSCPSDGWFDMTRPA